MPSPEFEQEVAGRFLEALIKQGGRLVAACDLVGISWATVYDWRRQSEDFATAMDDAVTVSTMVLEEEALRLALEGEAERRYDKEGKLVAEKVRRFPNLLMFMLEARKPNTYRRTLTIAPAADPTSAPVLEAVAHGAGRAFKLLSVAHKVERVTDVGEDGQVKA